MINHFINTTTMPTHMDSPFSSFDWFTFFSGSVIVGALIIESILYYLKDDDHDDDDDDDEDEENHDDINDNYCSKYCDEFKALVYRKISDEELSGLRSKFVREHVKDNVDVVLTFDKETDTFCYYTDSLKDVSYDILETVARKFVIDYDCKMICLQTDVDNKEDSDVAKDKKSTDINTLESNILNQHVQTVFAKFKKYNTGGKGAAPNFNSAVKVFEQMNHFRYKGKLHDYEETQKKYQPPIVDDKPILDYASYKKLLEKEKEN